MKNRITARIAMLVSSLLIIRTLVATTPGAEARTALQFKGAFAVTDARGKRSAFTRFITDVCGPKCRTENTYFNGVVFMDGTNGTNSYYLDPMSLVPQTNPNKWEWGKTSAGPFPAEDTTPGQLCWLAFASAQYFERHGHVRLPLEAFQENRAFLSCRISYLSRPPHLPKKIRWYGGNYWYLGKKNSDDRVRIPYPHGYLAGQYSVTSTTNVNGLEFPLSFQLKVFMPSLSGSKPVSRNKTTLVQILRGSVTNVQQTAQLADYRPQLGPRADITDFRLPVAANGNTISIRRLNGKWPTPADADFAQAMNEATYLARGKHHNRADLFTFAMIAFLVITFVCAALIDFRRRSRRANMGSHLNN